LCTDELAKAFGEIGGGSAHKGTKITGNGDVCCTTKNRKGRFCDFSAPLLNIEKMAFQCALHHI